MDLEIFTKRSRISGLIKGLADSSWVAGAVGVTGVAGVAEATGVAGAAGSTTRDSVAMEVFVVSCALAASGVWVVTGVLAT